jgi:hypothetical protein
MLNRSCREPFWIVAGVFILILLTSIVAAPSEANDLSASRTACASPKCAMTAEAGGRNVDRMQQPCCMEDGGRPSGGGLQDQPSNHPALRGDKLPGGERTGKRRA